MNIQGLVVMAIAALAAAYLAWRVVGPLFRGSASSGCHGCSTACEMKTVTQRKACGASAAPSSLHAAKSPAADHPR